MSKNFEQSFSLKDWVTNRAANMPEPVEEAVVQVQSMGETYMRTEKAKERIMPQFEAEPRPNFRVEPLIEKSKKIEQTDETMNEAEDVLKQPKMTARITGNLSNTSSLPSMTASPAQQIQIVRLLRDLGDRLRQSEKEREILWRELDSCRKLLTDIEDKTSKTEKAYLSIENKINARPVVDAEEAKEFKKSIEDKIAALETTTGSAVLRLEDVVSENSKLARRLEQAAQDKTLLLHKIEAMEEIVTQTQETLKAKALVLLTDHALASKTSLPQTPAWTGNDTLKTKEAPSAVANEIFGTENHPWWKTKTSIGVNKGALVSLIVLGLAAGWGFSKLDMPSFRRSIPEAAPKASSEVSLGAALEKPELEAAPAVPDKAMNDIAKMANDIEPGTENTPAASVASAEENTAVTAEDLAVAAEQKAKNTFDAEKETGAIAQRIKPDADLPAAIKVIQAKAFAGEAEAQHDLAAIYTAGHAGVKTNYPKAALWFTEAAHNGIGNAQYNLAVLYHQGLGVKQDTAKAINLYRIAASNNHPEAQYNLGIAHIEGIGADYNPQTAAYYFQKAAAGGVVEAAYNLGLIEENGLLGEAQPDEAIFWYKLAANRGNLQAKEALSQLSKQLNLSAQNVDQTFKKVSAEKSQYTKSLAPVPEKVAAVTPAPVKPPAKPTLRAASAPAAVKAPVSLVPAAKYDPVIVAQIQEQLIRLGLFSGSADGTADSKTQEAVRSYQSMNKIKVDGKPSEDVLVHMLASEMQVEPAAGSAN